MSLMEPSAKVSLDELVRIAREEGARGRKEVHPGIWKTPHVCGGTACIRSMRMPVWGLEEARRSGATDAELLDSYPDLTSDDLAKAWQYVELNREEIDEEIRSNDFDVIDREGV